MAHRYSTRSKTPTLIIDLTEPTPSRPKKSRRRTAVVATTSANLPNLENVGGGEMVVEINDDPIENNEQMEKEKKRTILPCLNTSFSGTPEILTCAICFEALSAGYEPMATPCGHIFCSGCLTKALNKTKRCPTCQVTTKLSNAIRLYF